MTTDRDARAAPRAIPGDVPRGNPDEPAEGRASLEDLARLHGLLARVLTERLLEGGVSASELNVVRQFLKDNGVDCARPPVPELGDLVAGLPFYEEEPDEDEDF